MSRLALTIIAIVAALLVGGVLVWQSFFANKKESDDGAPRIAIVTDAMLERMEEKQSTAQGVKEAVQLWAASQDKQHDSAAAKSKATGKPSTQPAADAASAPQIPSGFEQQSDIGAMRTMLGDQLEALINQRLTTSRRFAVMDVSSVQATLTKFSIQQPAAKTADPAADQSLLQRMTSGVARGDAANPAAKPGANANAASGAAQSAATQTLDSDLAGAAEALNARYLLYVSLKEPRSTAKYEFAINDNKLELVAKLEADPIFVYRLFDVRQKRSIVSDATQLSMPVTSLLPMQLGDDPITRENRQTDLVRAMRELGAQLQVRIADEVARKILDATFPAQIRSVSPLIVNRGTNDGIAVGDEVRVFRATADGLVKDQGEGGREIVIDAPEREVGAARVVSVQANSAELEPLNGAKFAVNDFVRRTSGGGGSTAAGAVSSSQGGLGKSDILANQANAAAGLDLIRERIAVGDIRIVNGDARQPATLVPIDRALVERLAREPRVEVMSREALNQLKREQNIGGARDSFIQGAGNIGKAGYMVLGDVTVTQRRQSTTTDVPGAEKRVLSSSTSLTAIGSFRIERLDSRVIDSFQVTASVPGTSGNAEAGARLATALAEATAKAMLPKLFPIEIAQIDGATIVLNRGQDVGLKVGQTLTVYRVGAPIMDPTTKAMISAGVRTPVGQVRISDVQETVSVAQAVGDGAGIAVGHVVAANEPAAPAKPRRATNAAQEAKPPAEGVTPW
jgi:curli biogenesis system outer membrane secretion channel CsgG